MLLVRSAAVSLLKLTHSSFMMPMALWAAAAMSIISRCTASAVTRSSRASPVHITPRSVT